MEIDILKNTSSLQSNLSIKKVNLSSSLPLTGHVLQQKRKSLFSSEIDYKKNQQNCGKSTKNLTSSTMSSCLISTAPLLMKNNRKLEDLNNKNYMARPMMFNKTLRENLGSSKSQLTSHGKIQLCFSQSSKTVEASLFSDNLSQNPYLKMNQVVEKRKLCVENDKVQEKICLKKQTFSKKQKTQINHKEFQYELYFAKEKKQKELDEYLKEKIANNQKLKFVDVSDTLTNIKMEQKKIKHQKMELINLVSVALLQSPNLEDIHDTTRMELVIKLKNMSSVDPEFILKLALYTRQHLNVRVVANFILSYAAYMQETKPYLKKYFCKAVVLPSDWIAVAELYQTFFDKSINFGSIPAALRKVMVEKFPAFDEYQLAKYNKGKKSMKKKPVFIKTPKDVNNESDMDIDSDDAINDIHIIDTEDEAGEFYELKSFTLKQLVRKLHVNQPVHSIMCLLGKKYPETQLLFYKSKLPGLWQEEQAGKRMKLSIPETWETQVSLKGNKAQTWQDLIDHNKLPFMAMLRNLRNMIISGLPDRYHSKIIKRLTDEKSVVNSRQFPFRFLSAFEVLEDLDKQLDGEPVVAQHRGRGVGRGRGLGRGQVRGRGRGVKIRGSAPLNTYNKAILKRYKKALDTALKIATVHNVSPICGSTLIICDVEILHTMGGKPNSSKRTPLEMQLLLALMCCYHCEDGIIILRNVATDSYYIVQDIDKENILENVRTLKEKVELLLNKMIGEQNLHSYLDKFISNRNQFNCCLHVTLQTGFVNTYIEPFINMYRREVNPTLLYVLVNVAAKGNCKLDGEYNVIVSGFSDQVLKYIAERGGGNQLTFVENIDKAHKLEDIKINNGIKILPVAFKSKIERPVMPWKSIRVFISSTFTDMHGERDLLTRFVFPELRCWCFNYCINVYEVDLRWGVTEQQARNSSPLENCMNEVMNSDLFIGLIGSRYGWCPDLNEDIQTKFPWLRDLSNYGYSITELEMRCFLQKLERKICSKASFYIRDNSNLNLKDIPKKFRPTFQCETTVKEKKLRSFIRHVKNTDDSFVTSYPCKWGGVYEAKPMVAGLDYFGVKVLNRLWDMIKKHHIDHQQDEEDEKPLDVSMEDASSHQGVVQRKQLLDTFSKVVLNANLDGHGWLIVVTGQSGIGKTSYMANICADISKTHSQDILYTSFFVESNKTPVQLLKHLLNYLVCTFTLCVEIPENYRELKQCFHDALMNVSKRLDNQSLILIVDGVDQLHVNNQSSLVDWIPESMTKHITLVVSCSDNHPCVNLLLSHQSFKETIKVGFLEYSDRATLVRQFLADYGKQLDESPFNNQMKILLSKKDSGSPSYLTLACDELRMFGVFEKLNAFLKQLAQTTPKLVASCLDRVERENDKELVKNALSLLFLSRQGLSQDSLFDMLNMLQNLSSINSMEEIIKVGSYSFFQQDLNRLEIPRSSFLKLMRMIGTFLSTPNKHDGSMQIRSREIKQLISKRYIHSLRDEYMSKLHIVLAGYYRKQADPSNKELWNGQHEKSFCELPYHMHASCCLLEELKHLLCDMFYIQAKINLKLDVQLLEDYEKRTLLSSNHKHKKEYCNLFNHAHVQQIKEFVVKNMHILLKYPELFTQQMINASEHGYIKSLCSGVTDEQLRYLFQWVNKRTLLSDCSLTNTSSTNPITCISLSRDETTIACGQANGGLILYDKQTTKELQNLSGHANSVTSCVFAGSSKLCSACIDGSIAIWDVHSGNRLHLIKKHKRQVSDLKITADGRLIISVGWDNSARLWNVNDGKEAGEFTSMAAYPINSVALNGTEKFAAVGGWKKWIYIWNVLENKKHAVYKGHESSIRSLAYSSSGKHLASASLAGEVIIWSTTNGAMLSKTRNAPIICLSYSSSGDQLIAGCTDSTIKLWSGNLGTPYKHYHGNKIDAQSNGYALCVAVCNKMVAVAYNSGMVNIFHVSGRLQCSFKASKSSVRTLCFIQEGVTYHLITGSDDHMVYRWNINFDGAPTLIHEMPGHSGSITSVRARKTVIVSSSEDTTLRVWPGILFDGDLGSEASDDEESDSNNKKIIKSTAVLYKHTGVVTCCDVSADEAYLISGSIDRSIILWDLETALLVISNAHSDGITACSWSDVGNYVVTGGNDLLLKLWDTKYLLDHRDDRDKLKEKIKFVGHTSSVMDVKYKFGCITSVSSAGALKVWTHKGVEITTLRPHHNLRIYSCEIWADVNELVDVDKWSAADEPSVQRNIRSLTSSHLNDILVFTASEDGDVCSYFPLKPYMMGTLNGHSKCVTDLAISAKGDDIFSCSQDSTIKQWNQQNSSSSLNNHAGGVSSVSVFDHTLSAVAGRDGVITTYKKNEVYKVVEASKNAVVTKVVFITESVIVYGDTDGVIKWARITADENDVHTVARLHSPVQCLSVGGDHTVTYLAVTTYMGVYVYKLNVKAMHMNEIVCIKRPEGDFYTDELNYRALDFKFVSRRSAALLSFGLHDIFLMTNMDNLTILKKKQASDPYSMESKSMHGVLKEQASPLHVDALEGMSFFKRSTVQSRVMCAYEDGATTYLVMGNIDGTLTFDTLAYKRNQYKQTRSVTEDTKVHDDAVTGLLLFKCTATTNDTLLLVTASKDCTVKLWKYKLNDEENMKQVGLFHCNAPITCIDGCQHESNLHLVVGDNVGNAEFLLVTV